MDKKLITALIPAYNEEDCIYELYNRVTNVLKGLNNYDYEILIINDGSKDNTIFILEELHNKDNHVQYVNFDYAKGDVVVILDADLQTPPELIPEMLKYYEEGYDDVYGRRKSRDDESFLKRFGTKLYYKALQSLTRVDILKNTSDFRMLSRKAVEALKKYREHNRYTKGIFALIGLNKKEFLYEPAARFAGRSKWNYLSLLNLAVEGITSFSTFPLRLSSILGFVTALVGFIYILFLVIKTLIFGADIKGYPTLLSVIIFLGGIQLLSLGVIGEYLGRIFNEVKNRPLYLVEKYSGDNNK